MELSTNSSVCILHDRSRHSYVLIAAVAITFYYQYYNNYLSSNDNNLAETPNQRKSARKIYLS